MKKITLVTVAIITLSAAYTLMAKERDPNERAIAAREAAFTLMAANVGPMGAMAKGEMPFDKKQFALRAANLDALSKMPWEFFIPGSDKGKSESKPEVWSKADDFKKMADEFQQEVAKLAEVSKGDNQEAIFAQFGETTKACKSCHKEFKKKD